MAFSMLSSSVPLISPNPKLKCLKYPRRNLCVNRRMISMYPRRNLCVNRMTMSTGSDVSASPWLMIPPSMEGVYNFYSLEEKKELSLNKSLEDEDAVVVGSSHGWLALFNNGSNRDLFLWNPVTRRHIKLPPIDTLTLRDGGNIWPRWVHKVIISCSPDEEEEEECRVLIKFGTYEHLAFCCPNRSTEWTPIGSLGDTYPRHYEDFTYWKRKKQFVCITKDPLELECWDLSDPLCPRIVWSDVEVLDEEYDTWLWEWSDQQKDNYLLEQVRYLVSASDRLYLVTRHYMESVRPDGTFAEEDAEADDEYWTSPYKTFSFDVHRIEMMRDDEQSKVSLRYMPSSLDGLAMFVGLNNSFAIEATAEFNLKPNSIYFTDDSELQSDDYDADVSFGGHDIGIFDYQNRTISPCYYPCDIQSIRRIIPTPLWFAPNHCPF